LIPELTITKFLKQLWLHPKCSANLVQRLFFLPEKPNEMQNSVQGFFPKTSNAVCKFAIEILSENTQCIANLVQKFILYEENTDTVVQLQYREILPQNTNAVQIYREILPENTQRLKICREILLRTPMHWK
jgi:hypothetical protein